MNVARFRAFVHCLLAVGILGGCGQPGDTGDPLAEIDPAVAMALSDQLMSDPDLVSINEANAALTRSASHALPGDLDTPEAIREAQDRAVVLLGGTRAVPDLPVSEALPAETEQSPLVMLADVAARLPGAAACLRSARYAADWAARLPAASPVFPRAAVVEALGTDTAGCRMRAVRFRSAVPAEDSARFYLGMAKQAGYTGRYAEAASGWQLSARNGPARILVSARPSLLGHQEIDLITIAAPAAPAPPAPR